MEQGAMLTMNEETNRGTINRTWTQKHIITHDTYTFVVRWQHSSHQGVLVTRPMGHNRQNAEWRKSWFLSSVYNLKSNRLHWSI